MRDYGLAQPQVYQHHAAFSIESTVFRANHCVRVEGGILARRYRARQSEEFADVPNSGPRPQGLSQQIQRVHVNLE